MASLSERPCTSNDCSDSFTDINNEEPNGSYSDSDWDSDEDEWRFSRRKLLEEDNSEEYDVNSSNEDIWDADESSVGSDDEESDEPPWNYDSSNDDHHDVMSSYSHEEEIDFAY